MPSYPAITSKTIKYDSPSGKVNIGKYIPPFEKVKDGFGFMGVVVEDEKAKKIQCHICGKWFQQLGQHLNHTHKTNSVEYKKRFGLLCSTALKTKKMRLRQSEVMSDMRRKHKKHRFKFKKNNKFAGNRKGETKAVESKNKYGVCDLQIMQKIIELKEELGKAPTLTDLKNRYGDAFIFHIQKRYKSYVDCCKEIGFQAGYSNFNPKYSKEYFIEKALSNEASLRIFTINEERAFYKYVKGGVQELKQLVEVHNA